MTLSEDGSHDGIMSERTLTIAGRIYADLQSMIRVHGDEVIAELMPLIVGVLEELDVAFQECDDAVQALEELRDELAQCKQEIKRQKQLREMLEEEKSTSEDVLETERKRLSENHIQLQTLNKSMSLNLSAKKDYIQSIENRMVELESDHRELERRHIDTIQQLVKSKKTIREQSLIIEKNNSTSSRYDSPNQKRFHHNSYISDPDSIYSEPHDVPRHMASSPMFCSTPVKSDQLDEENVAPTITCNDNSLRDELKLDKIVLDEVETKQEEQKQILSIMKTDSDDELEDLMKDPATGTGQNLYDELNGLPVGITSPTKHQDLIREASELLVSNPASRRSSSPASRRSSVFSAGDNEMMQSLLKEKQDLEEVRGKLLKENNDLLTQLQQTESISEASQNKVQCLELENKNISEKMAELENTLKHLRNSQHEHPLLTTKTSEGEDARRFTRGEMDKVIREKNMYKEKYLELQEDLRYVEIQNEAPNEKSKFWTLFSGLFARRRAASELSSTDERKMKKLPDLKEENDNNKIANRKSPMTSRHFIQGWSLPHDVATQSLADMDFIQTIPAPIYCGPLGSLENERKSLVRCCATADSDDHITTRYMTWVCCEKDGQGEVFIVDPANPTEIKESFVATKSAIICISYVPAAVPPDLEMRTLNTIVSDSDNESISDNEFEHCTMNKSRNLLLHQPTFWLGTQNGIVAIHSAVDQCDTLLNRIRLKDSILAIKYIKTHDIVLVGCADSSVTIFSKHQQDGPDMGWNTDHFRVILLDLTYLSGKSMTPLPVSVITQVNEYVWAAYGGNIAILVMPDATIKDDIVFSEGHRSLVTHMVTVGNGVWIACRFNSILTLLDSNTIQPLQQVNMEEVLKPVSVSYGFTTLIRVSAVLCYNNLLWIGTSQGALVTIPLKSLSPAASTYITEPPPDSEPMFAVRDEARISLHGHQGSVRYILVAKYSGAGEELSSRKLSNSSSNSEVLLRRRSACTRIVLSGGEGYISYRDMDAGTLSTIRRGRIIRGFTDHCHMIAWDVSGPSTTCN